MPSTTDPIDAPLEPEPEQDDIVDDIEIDAGLVEAMPLEELTESVLSNPRALKNPAILAAMAALKTNDLIEYDLLLAEIKKTHKGLKVDTVRTLVDECIKMTCNVPVKPIEGDKDAAQAAQVIIKAGTSYEYLYKVWQQRVKGNEYLGKALMVSRGVQSCLNTKGLHIYAHGKHGHGKSEGMEKAIELVPPEYRMDEDVSPLAIYYASQHGMLLTATSLLIDEMVWGDAIAGMLKRIITRFQKGAGHLTVIDGVPVRVRTQPRLSIWTNSADMQADEQLRDRFFDVAVTEGKDYVHEIMEFQKIRDTLPDTSDDVDKETAICQAILRDLAEQVFTTKIPFSQRIQIAASEGTRGYNIFSDLIKGLAAMRYAIRETDELGQLLATEADFETAKDIYEGARGHSEESYTTSEAKVLNAIIDHGHKALYKDIKILTGMSEGRIKDIVNGRGKDEQKRHGLRYKCVQLDVATVDISILIPGSDSARVTTHPVELSLPTTYQVPTGKTLDLVILVDADVADVAPVCPIDVDEINNKRDCDVGDVVKQERGGKEIHPEESSIPSLSLKTQNTTSATSQLSLIAKPATSVDPIQLLQLRQGLPLASMVEGVYQSMAPTEGECKDAKVPEKSTANPGKEKFMQGLKKHTAKQKRTCHICERTFDYDLTSDQSDRSLVGCYICTTCLMEHRTREKPAPIETITQTKLSEVA